MSHVALHIHEVTVADPHVLDGLNRLLPQLDPAVPALTQQRLAAVLASPATRLLVAEIDGQLVGCLTLVIYPLTTRARAVIDDVVVDGAARGRGVGAALIGEAVRLAKDAGARVVDLTSRPHRETANRLYLRLGFIKRETNVYRVNLDGDGHV